jgi:hypothetical protein
MALNKINEYEPLKFSFISTDLSFQHIVNS